MNLTLYRLPSLPDSTLGGLTIDGRFSCFALEDEKREVKVAGETRIPAGNYAIKLRTEGGIHEKYKVRFMEHKGMLWLQDVPGFTYIYIHCGTTDEDTSGCILVADTARAEGTLERSAQAYRRVYGQVLNAIQAGEPVSIEVRD
jgi:hypothetical protein